MRYLLLFLAMTGQTDYRFMLAVEDFVIDASGPAAVADSMPTEIYDLIELSGADYYPAREVARRQLIAMGDPVIPWLFWGMRHRDAQIRLSCWMVILRLCSCTKCHGGRWCGYFTPDESGITCVHCGRSYHIHGTEYDRSCENCSHGLINMSLLRF